MSRHSVLAAWRRGLAASAVAWRRSVIKGGALVPVTTARASQSDSPSVPAAISCRRGHSGPWEVLGTRASAGCALRVAPVVTVTPGHGAVRSFSRAAQGSGSGRNRGDEMSVIFTNVAKNEKLKNKEVWALQHKTVLFVKDDGSKEQMPLKDVLEEAAKLDLDPVMVSGTDGKTMPVLKLMDAGRKRHDMQKKKREAAKNNTGSQSQKELRFGLHIDSNDLQTKMKQARTFLEKGHRVRIFMQLKGADFHRNQKLALTRLDEIAALIGDAGTQDGKPNMSGNVVSTIMAPNPASKQGGSKDAGKVDKPPIGDDTDAEPCTAEDVQKQGDKVRAMKETRKSNPEALSEEAVGEEIEVLKAMKARLQRQTAAAR